MKLLHYMEILAGNLCYASIMYPNAAMTTREIEDKIRLTHEQSSFDSRFALTLNPKPPKCELREA
jgi:hypothetical protein